MYSFGVKEMSELADGMILLPTSDRKKWIYASPRMGINLFMGIVDFVLLFLYKEVYNLDAILVGIALMLGKLAIALAQFLIAWLSDHTKTRWGRRKPYLIIMSPILALSFIMLILPSLILGPSPEETILFSWFAGFNMLAQSCYAVTSVYHSWTAEQFLVQERPRVSQYQNLFNFVGLGAIILMSFLVLPNVKVELARDPTKIPPLFMTLILLFAAVLIGLMYAVAFYMPVEKTPIYQTHYKEELIRLVKNKNFMSAVFMHGFGSLAWAMINGIMLGYLTVVLNLEGTTFYIIAGVLAITLVGSLAVWRKSIETSGKKKTLLFIFGSGAILYPLSMLGLLPISVNPIFAIFFVFLLASTQSGWSLFPYIIYADLAEDHQKQHGELSAGLFTGFPSILLNIFQAISLYFSGLLLSLPEVGNVMGNCFSLGYVLWGPICSVIFIITVLFVNKDIKLDFEWEKKASNQPQNAENNSNKKGGTE